MSHECRKKYEDAMKKIDTTWSTDALIFALAAGRLIHDIDTRLNLEYGRGDAFSRNETSLREEIKKLTDQYNLLLRDTERKAKMVTTWKATGHINEMHFNAYNKTEQAKD